MSYLVYARTAVYNLNYHMVWTVKYRRQILVGKVEARLKELIFDIAQDKGFDVKSLQTMPDHVDVFVSAHPKYSHLYIYKMLKGISGRRLFMEFPEIAKRLWKGQMDLASLRLIQLQGDVLG